MKLVIVTILWLALCSSTLASLSRIAGALNNGKNTIGDASINSVSGEAKGAIETGAAQVGQAAGDAKNGIDEGLQKIRNKLEESLQGLKDKVSQGVEDLESLRGPIRLAACGGMGAVDHLLDTLRNGIKRGVKGGVQLDSSVHQEIKHLVDVGLDTALGLRGLIVKGVEKLILALVDVKFFNIELAKNLLEVGPKMLLHCRK